MKGIIIAMLVGMSAAASGQQLVTTVTPDFVVHCTFAGQLCEPPFAVSVATESELRIRYSVRETHCSSIRVHMFVDDVLKATSDPLGWYNAPSPYSNLPLDTGVIDLGPVAPGIHKVAFEAEGTPGGCNHSGPSSWGGIVRKFTTPLTTSPRSSAFVNFYGPSRSFTCNGLPVTATGDINSNTIYGTPGRDVISGQGGNDKIYGLGGNDVICGGAGKDTLSGGKGADKLYGDSGKDRLDGGKGRDRCVGGSGRDKLTCEVSKQ